MTRGDIHVVALDSTPGREQRGSRPVLVVSSTAFNQATKLPVICPMTNEDEFARRIGSGVPLSGTKTTGVVRCDQPRVLDPGARGSCKVHIGSTAITDEVLAKLGIPFE